MNLLEQLEDPQMYTCKKPILTLDLDNRRDQCKPIETSIEIMDLNEKSRLVQAFNISHQKPGFKVSR